MLVSAFRKIPKATWNAKERSCSISLSISFMHHAKTVVSLAHLFELSRALSLSMLHCHWTCRLWTFPVPFLSSAEKVLSEISGYNVEVVTCAFLFLYDYPIFSRYFILLKKKNYFGGCDQCKEEGFSLKKQNAFYKL